MLNKLLNTLAGIPIKQGLKKYQIFHKDKTSLILVNCQKGVLDEQQDLRTKLKELIHFARENNWKIIHAPFSYTERKFPPPALLLLDKKLKVSSTSHELMYVEEGDIILPNRSTLSAFAETGLEEILRKNNLEHLVLAGPMTDLTVDSTMRDGVQNDFHVAVITDTIAMTKQSQSIQNYRVTLERYAQTVTNLKGLKRLSAKS